jgi:hypothetical protein
MMPSRPFALSFVAVVAAAGLPAACTKAPAPDVPDDVFGHCVYENPFAKQEECAELRGDGWDKKSAEAACDEHDAALEDGPCPYDEPTGACVMPTDDPSKVTQLVMPVGECGSNERGCELFGGGTFVEGPACGGENAPDPDEAYNADDYYVPETLVCADPLPGEPAGNGPDGQVCQWAQMSGCTEPGRRFEDYASCEDIRTQRPYHPVPPNDTEPLDDPRMQDAVYAADVAWAKEQLDSCACVCCHKGSAAPEGASVFDTEHPGNFLNSFSTWGLAFGANAFDSSLLGNYTPEQNNGFTRTAAGMPSTDPVRMQAIFQRELEHRGSTMEEWADVTPQPDIFYQQYIYEADDCEEGEGVAADGSVRWTGGRARYLYVLDASAENPMLPPNMDKPAGTLWRIDTLPPAVPAKTGEVIYGAIPDGHEQEIPAAAAAPAPLVEGQRYKIWALADIGQPMTRCVFTFPVD